MHRALALAAGLLALPALAQAPISAIGWLSESIKNPPPFEIAPEQPPLVPTLSLEVAEKKYLMGVSPDAIGLLAPSVTGFPANMWGDMSVREVANILRIFPEQGTPEGRALFRRILLAQANPPHGDQQLGLVLQARVDRLFALGALDAAEALVTLNQPVTRTMFSRTFDIAILTDRTLKICQAIADAPALSEDLSQKVYCLARGGDWNAAAITLSLGATIGAIAPLREELLIRFLDPELFEGAPDPAIPEPLVPMDFVLREASVLPRPAGLLPLPYLYRDTALRAALRQRIEATERLVKSGALPASLLFSAYRTGQSASSGGVWGRHHAVQALDNALETGQPQKIAQAIKTANQALGDIGLLTALAEEYGERLATLPYDPAYGDVVDITVDLVHLANLTTPDWERHDSSAPRRDLAQKLVQHSPLQTDDKTEALSQAICDALSGNVPETAARQRLQDMLALGNTAEAVLGALALLANGAAGDPGSIGTGLYILTQAGQEAAARRIAVQILLLPTEG